MKISIMGQVLDKSRVFVKRLFQRLFSMAARVSVGVSAILPLILDVFLPKKKIQGTQCTHNTHPYLAVRGIIMNLMTEAHSQSLDSSMFKALLPYQNKLVKKILWDFKYYFKPYAVSFCKEILYDELISDMSDRIKSIPFSKPRLVVHCPSSTFFRGEKSFDHMKELLRVIENEQNSVSPFFTACVHAIVPHLDMQKAQHLSSRAERLILAQSRFIFSKEFIRFMKTYISHSATGAKYAAQAHTTLSGLADTIYCIDDVMTTGATFAAINHLFKKEFEDTNRSIKVQCIALSH